MKIEFQFNWTGRCNWCKSHVSSARDRWDTYCDSCVWLTNESALNSSSSARDSSTGLSGQTLKLLTACNTLQQPKKVNDQCKTINKTENGTCGNSTKRLLHKRRAKNSNGAPKKKQTEKKMRWKRQSRKLQSRENRYVTARNGNVFLWKK